MSSQNKFIHNITEAGFEKAKDVVEGAGSFLGPKAVADELTAVFYEPSAPIDPEKIAQQQQEEADKEKTHRELVQILHQQATAPIPKDPNELSKYDQTWKDMKDREEAEKQEQGSQPFQEAQGKAKGRLGQGVKRATTDFESKHGGKA